MLYWLFAIIASYLFFALFSFGDKLILSGPLRPKAYAFYVGVLSILTLFLAPFAHMALPQWQSLIWIILEAIVFMVGMYSMFLALTEFEVSTVIPAMGALQSLLIFFITGIVYGGFAGLQVKDTVAFFLLLAGTFVISKDKHISINVRYVSLVLLSSLMFSLDFIFSKVVFTVEPLLSGIIWMKLCTALLAAGLLLSRSWRQEVFAKNNPSTGKTKIIFVLTQFSGAVAGLLQFLAISLVSFAYLPILNALKGFQYIFLFAITSIFSLVSPQFFKERISWAIVAKKSIAILIIFIGLAILVL